MNNQITYADKVALNQNSNIPDNNKVNADDMNEIKAKHNGVMDGSIPMGNVVVDSIRSKNILDISLFSTQTLNGITFTNNGNGTITINGTATDTFGITIATPKLKANTYYMTIGATTPTNFYIYDFDSSSEIIHVNTATTLTQDYNNTAFGTYITNGTTFNNITIYPQLEVGDEATSFSPYQQLGTDGNVNFSGNVSINGTLSINGGITNKAMPSKNLDDCRNPGTYNYDNGDNSYTNAPATDGIHILNVLNNGDLAWVIQEDYVLRWAGAQPDKYIRMRTVPGWSSWTKIV